MASCEAGIIKKVKEEIVCSVCQEEAADPRILHGSHFFCKMCIDEWSGTVEAGAPLECPLCREKVSLPDGGVDQLPVANWVVRLQEDHANSNKQIICSEHNEHLKLYCFTCEKPVCYECILKDGHIEHDYKKNVEVASEERRRLQESMDPLKEICADFNKALERYETLEKEVKENGHLISSYIEASFKELHAILEERKEKLLVETRNNVAEQMAHLQEKQKDIFHHISYMKHVVEETEHSISTYSDDEIMIKRVDLNNVIKESIQSHDPSVGVESEASVELTPLRIKLSDCILHTAKFLAFCEKKFRPLDVEAFDGDAIIDNDDLAVCKGKKITWLVYCKTPEANIESYIMTSEEEWFSDCEVEKVGYMVHLVHFYAPEQPGDYKVHVLVNDIPAANGPVTFTIPDDRSIKKKFLSKFK